MRGEQAFLAFNRGMISRLAMARTDLKRYGLSSQEQTNWVSRVLGSTMLRPGFGYLGATQSNSQAKLLPFVFSATDKALLELTDLSMRVWVSDALVTRPAVTAPITNGDFTTNLTGWTDIDQGSASSDWVTGGYLGLLGSGSSYAGRRQAVTTSNNGTQHALRIVVLRGTIDVNVGTAAGGTDLLSVTLTPGTHSLTFTPTANFSIDITSYSPYQALLDSINIEAAGVMALPTPWGTSNLSMVRFDQSADVVFAACTGIQQQRIERRSTTSWSVVAYEVEKGPFRPTNTGITTITPSGYVGNITLTSSIPLFKSTHGPSAASQGALFQIVSIGQTVTKTMGVVNDVTNSISASGVGTDRSFGLTLTGLTGTGNTVVLQRSSDDATWSDVAGQTFTTDQSFGYNDTLDNQLLYYRLKMTVYASGSTFAALSIATGSIIGVARVTSFVSSTVVNVEVLSDMGASGVATSDWAEGAWSDYRGWPSAVCLSEGRLWWAGKDKFYGSVSDDFANFDPEYEGDAAPIIRSIGSGPVDVINWLLPMQRLMAGTDGSVVAGRSSSLDEPLTATNFNPKPTLTQGCARLAAVKVDGSGMFVQRGGFRVLSMAYSINDNDYAAEDMSALVPEIGRPGIVSFGTQRQSDTRVHAVRSDGKVALMIYDKLEDVRCWILIETDGFIEDVCILPDDDEDAVYYVVRRVIGGVDKRYLERWAREDEAVGGTVNKQADSFILYSGVAATVITGLGHLEGEQVVVWADGQDFSPGVGDDQTKYTVTGGQITLPEAVTEAVVGIGYESRLRSTKLAYLTVPGESGLTTRKRIHSVGLVLADTHPQGLEYGPDFDTMDGLPLMEAYELVDEDGVWDEYNYEAFSFPGEWKVDARMCLRATAPRPCTLLAAVVGMNANPTS
jgi:hypothetical protein